jgi:hypothetical protein
MMGQTSRRWQFRLSTWCWLVAILGLALVSGPVWLIEPVDFAAEPFPVGGGLPHSEVRVRLNPRSWWPVLATVALVAWKGGWLLRERRQEGRRQA